MRNKLDVLIIPLIEGDRISIPCRIANGLRRLTLLKV